MQTMPKATRPTGPMTNGWGVCHGCKAAKQWHDKHPDGMRRAAFKRAHAPAPGIFTLVCATVVHKGHHSIFHPKRSLGSGCPLRHTCNAGKTPTSHRRKHGYRPAPKLPATTPAKPKTYHNNNTIEPLCGSDGLLGIAVKSGTNWHCDLFATTERAVWAIKTGRNGMPNGPYGNTKQHKSPTVWLPIDYAKPQQKSTRQANRLGSIVLAPTGKPWKQLSSNNT